jgi:integrase
MSGCRSGAGFGHALQHGVAMAKISLWLGHSSIVTTERHYAWLADRYDPDCEKI